jgi:NADH dehydrogenase
LESGYQVKTVTTYPNKPNPFGDRVQASSYNFENPGKLIQFLSGGEILFNTYWIRFNYKHWSFLQALKNTAILFHCAQKAGVQKIVQISVTNPSLRDKLPYYRGKAIQEKILAASGVDFAIIRPTLVFGVEDILVNNIAWIIRKFPVVPIFGSGQYQVQPVFVENLARLAVSAGCSEGPQLMDATGPETFTFEAFLKLIARELRRQVLFVHISPSLGILLGKIIGLFVRDVLLTQDELRGLMANKLISKQEPNCETRFSEWLPANAQTLGKKYTSELDRHFYWKEES